MRRILAIVLVLACAAALAVVGTGASNGGGSYRVRALFQNAFAPGAGEHMLPVQNTSRPIDIDLVNNIMRLPYRERLGILINEFGTGLAGRGQDLSSIIRNADPALKATDKVLNLLAGQNRVLADL